MKTMHLPTRLLSLLLVVALLCGFAVPASAAGTDSAQLSFERVDNSTVSAGLHGAPVGEEAESSVYAANDVVRVSIVLEKESTVAAGFSTKGIAQNSAAMDYRADLAENQKTVTARIEKATGMDLDVVWNLTLAANIISANVPYSQIETIEQVAGVEAVYIETRYEPAVVDTDEPDDPLMATSSAMIGSASAWAAGYTGAGGRVAVIDTGIDTDHQSFDADALMYSLTYQAGVVGKDPAEFLASLNMLDAEEVAGVKDQLNVNIDPAKTYISKKIPFAYNYIDKNYNITHDTDTQGEHGSHVEGIAAANRYIPNGDGTFSNALKTVLVQGVAPDAQILTMKVFGSGGGAYDSDYMAAIEDAVVLGADSVNLSLGSANPGFSRQSNNAYQEILNNLETSGTVVAMSAGNSGGWADSAATGGYLYSDDVGMHTNGSPGSYNNSLAVASVDNDGASGEFFSVGDQIVVYNQTTGYKNAPMNTLIGEHEYVLIDGFGTEEDFAAVANVLAGKIAVCSRGSTSFYQKAEAAVKYGAIATIIYNNTTGVINMDLSDYTKTAPCVSITQVDGAMMKAAATAMTEGEAVYYLGTLKVEEGLAAKPGNSEYKTMSDFSSWGVPGSLKLKPEITAPGGSIYSVNGAVAGGKAYELMSGTSMASPQVAGMAVLVAQYIRENGLEAKTGKTARQLAQSLLMSTAVPMMEAGSAYYYSVLRQGAGLANVGNAVSAGSYIMMGEEATQSASDGKVKAELGDDPDRTGAYRFSFSINNFSDGIQNYTLSSDFFTQDLFMNNGSVYMDTLTAPIAAKVTFEVDGETFVPTAGLICDLDNDGDTDADDAQIILNYCAGLIEDIAPIADVDGDGAVTTYDAYLILSSLEAKNIVVAPNGSVNVVVDVQLTNEAKAYLDANYVNGAYVEGYVYAKPVDSVDGAVGVTHSIPVLGFYGNWSDPSMYDQVTYTGVLHGDTTVPYLNVKETNNLLVKYAGDSGTYWQIGNPYVREESYPADRAAVTSTTTLYQYRLSMIRNAAAVTCVVTNDAGEVLYTGPVTNQAIAAYYYKNGGVWRNTSANYTMNTKVSTLGVKENERIHVSLVAVPEYYETNGNMTADDVKALIESNTLGKGAFLTTSLTVDNTAPELLAASKNLLTGDLIIKARDNQYIAAVMLLNKAGSQVLVSALPEQNEAGETVETVLDMTGVNPGSACKILVADYAGNETVYDVEYGGEQEDNTGKMYGFTASNARGENGPRWMEIDPDTVWYYNTSNYGGATTVATTDIFVTAAEYVDGYVYMAARDGYIYAAPQDDLSDYATVGKFSDTTASIVDMALNYVDGKLYAMDDNNTIYTVDFMTGALTQVATITIVNPKGSTGNYLKLRALAIDNDGTFYSINDGSTTSTYLYKWTLDNVVEGKIENLAAANPDVTVGVWSKSLESMAWDHDHNILYLASGYGTYPSVDTDNKLWIVNPETGKATRSNETYAGGYSASSYASRIYAQVVGLYIIPSASQLVKPTDEAQSIVLDKTELTLLKGVTVALKADVYPWTLTDKTVTWSSSDETVATVENGLVRGVGVGEATITVTTNAKPNLTATCQVTVEQLPEIQLSGLVYDADGKTYWSDLTTNDPAAWTKVAEGSSYIAGALMDDMIYLHDGSTMYGVDADAFAVTSFGSIASSWIWSDAAPAPATEDGLFGKVAGLCNSGAMFELINPAEGSLSYWDLSTAFGSDPMAALAYISSGTYDYRSLFESYDNCPAIFYYMLTEGGELWKLTVFTYNNGESYSMVRTDMGNVGLELPNVSAVTGGSYASMIYDETSGYLLLSTYLEGETANLYAIDPETQLAADLGTYGEKIWPVVSLYQYERVTDLTLKMNKTSLNLYEGDTAQLTVKVKPSTFTGGVTWSSSDETIATVDADGVVTAVGAGTATVTATSVDRNAAGEVVTVSATVNVAELTSVQATVKAQITTDEGAKWVTIDGANLGNLTVEAEATTTFTGAGAHAGKLYGTNSDFTNMCNIYQIDPANGYAEAEGSQCSTSYAILDMTTSPAMTVSLPAADGTMTEYTAFDAPFYIANVQYAAMLTDYVEGNLKGWNLSSAYKDLAAITYAGTTQYNYQGTDYDAEMFLVLGADGSLYQFIAFASEYTDANGLGYVMARGTIGNIGMDFESHRALTMTLVDTEAAFGLLIGDASQGYADLYFVDLDAETMTCGKIGRIPGATGISGLHTDAELSAGVPANLENIADHIHFVEEEAQMISAAEIAETATTEDGVEMASREVSMTTALDSSVVAGSTQAIRGAVAMKEHPVTVNSTGAAVEAGAVALTLTEDEDVTNGLIRVTYDPAVLTYVDTTTLIGNFAVKAEDGVILFDYATAKAILAGNVLATMNFTFDADSIDTEIMVETLQRNADTTITGETTTVPVSFSRAAHTVTYEYPNLPENCAATVKVQDGRTYVPYGAEDLYDGLFDANNYWRLDGWQDQNGNEYGLGEAITVTSDLTLTPVYTNVLLLADGETEEVLKVLFEDEYVEYYQGKNNMLALDMEYTTPAEPESAPVSPMAIGGPAGDSGIHVSGTRKTVKGIEEDVEYTFAGWFFTSYDGEYGAGLNWSRSNSVTTQNLFASEQVENHRIYAYWIEADYSKATIGYRTTSTTAQSVYVNSTVPDDLFSAYGFVVSTAANATEEEMFIGNTIDGKQVGSYEKGYVYESFKASPIYNRAYTANEFNGGLPGYDQDGNGYVTYFYWKNMQLKSGGNYVTFSARPYYVTMDGTVVYGTMDQVTFVPNRIYNPLEMGN